MEMSDYSFDAIHKDEIRLLSLLPVTNNDAILIGELLTCWLPPEAGSSQDQSSPAYTNDRENAGGGYDAVSYHQGSDKKESAVYICVKDQPTNIIGKIQVPLNTELALKCFRALPPDVDLDYLWIDTICINQDNHVEKGVQIAKMAEIYRQAKNVRVWLGEQTEKRLEAMEFVESLNDFSRTEALTNDAQHVPKWVAFMDLMRCPYFSRRWVIQEVCLARSAYVHCGPSRIDWNRLRTAVGIFTKQAPRLKRMLKGDRRTGNNAEFLGDTDVLGAKTLVHLTDNIFRKIDGEIFDHLYSLESLVSALIMFETRNPYDLIYSILWLAHDTTPSADPSAGYDRSAVPSRTASPTPPATSSSSDGSPTSQKSSSTLAGQQPVSLPKSSYQLICSRRLPLHSGLCLEVDVAQRDLTHT